MVPMAVDTSKIKVAVIGVGALGLVTVKNLLEEGFNVTGFENKSYVGGLWKYTLDPNTTSVLPTTTTNISKERGCYTDYPFPDETPSLCPSAHVAKYLDSYADHFQLRPHIRLNSAVTGIVRDDENNKWLLVVDGDQASPLAFDKVIIATGINSRPSMPAVEGIETFSGTVIHSQAYKRPEDFEGKNVVVVGFGSTAADTATELVGHANKIYMAHRHGVYLLPRLRNGQSADHTLTYRMVTIQGVLEKLPTALMAKMVHGFMSKMQREAFPSIADHPEWGFKPTPAILPTVSDELVPALEKGQVISVPALTKVGSNWVELADGTAQGMGDAPKRLDDIDVIIFATGYKAEVDALLEDRVKPTRNTTSAWAATPGSRGKPLPRLYRNVFSLDYPDSLAFMGCVAFATPAFQLYDIASMVVAQIWSGRGPALPSEAVMNEQVDKQHAWIIDLAKRGPVYPQMVQQGEWLAWADQMAGTGIAEHLGWGSWTAWKFWWTDEAFYRLLTLGVYSPHLYRVFDGRRKKWAGAREAIEKMNAAIEASREATKQKTDLTEN